MSEKKGGAGFFRNIFRKAKEVESIRPKLIDIVPKTHNTGYVFLDINNDVGDVCEVIMGGANDIRMAYGYARRIAFAACHLQGIAEKGGYEHVCTVFKAIQLQTNHSVEFQEQAFSDAIEFIKSYIPLFTSILAKNLCLLAQDYEHSQGRLSDGELIKSVLDFAFSETKKTNSTPSKPCLVDLIEKKACTKIGGFANMFEDIKREGEKMISDPLLSTAAGYAVFLAGAGVFLGGAVRPEIVLDSLRILESFTEGHHDQEIVREGKIQALELAKAYVPEIDEEAFEEFMVSASEFVNFCVGEERRLTPSEVVARAKLRANSRRLGGWTIPEKIEIHGLNP